MEHVVQMMIYTTLETRLFDSHPHPQRLFFCVFLQRNVHGLGTDVLERFAFATLHRS